MIIAEYRADLVEILWSSCAVSLRTEHAEHKLLAWAHDPGQADKPDPLGCARSQIGRAHQHPGLLPPAASHLCAAVSEERRRPYTLQYLLGHEDMATAREYVKIAA